jgi:hypothetical protein
MRPLCGKSLLFLFTQVQDLVILSVFLTHFMQAKIYSAISLRKFCVQDTLIQRMQWRFGGTGAFKFQPQLSTSRVRQILHRAISFFGGSLKTAFMYHHCPRPSMKFVIG